MDDVLDRVRLLHRLRVRRRHLRRLLVRNCQKGTVGSLLCKVLRYPRSTRGLQTWLSFIESLSSLTWLDGVKFANRWISYFHHFIGFLLNFPQFLTWKSYLEGAPFLEALC